MWGKFELPLAARVSPDDLPVSKKRPLRLRGVDWGAPGTTEGLEKGRGIT